MPISNRDQLEPGTQLVATYKDQEYRCSVSKGDNGRLAYRVDGIDKVFTSPSGAGSAVMNGTACDGWRFWTRESERNNKPPKAEKPPKKAPRAKAAGTKAKPGAVPVIKAMRNQKGTPEGQTRYFCSACGDGFFAPTDGGLPDTCPEGHAALEDQSDADLDLSDGGDAPEAEADFPLAEPVEA